MTDRDMELLRRAFDLARRARAHGNEPFGAVLADAEGAVLAEAQNTISIDRDVTAHAEMNLVRVVARGVAPEVLRESTIYASTEPCAMCTGAIFWSGIGRVVYGLSSPRLYSIFGGAENCMPQRCGEVLSTCGRSTVVEGPCIENEAAEVFS